MNAPHPEFRTWDFVFEHRFKYIRLCCKSYVSNDGCKIKGGYKYLVSAGA